VHFIYWDRPNEVISVVSDVVLATQYGVMV